MTPSAAILANAAETRTVVDSLGRRLSLRGLTALDRLRIFKAAGAELALNQPWLAMASLASSVTAIDDIPIPMPTTEVQIEALIARLGDRGIDAIAQTIDPYPDNDTTEQVTSAGNLLGTPRLTDCLYLVRNGVPFDVAFSLPPDERMAYVVTFGCLDGQYFDWCTHRWRQST